MYNKDRPINELIKCNKKSISKTHLNTNLQTFLTTFYIIYFIFTLNRLNSLSRTCHVVLRSS